MKPILAGALLAFSTGALAQYQIGGGVGVYRQWLREASGNDDHEYASFSNYEEPALSAAIYYREAIHAHVNLGLELRFQRRTFDVTHGFGGLGGSTNESLHADLDLVYLTITPEVRMDPKGTAVVRFGPMIGQRLGGRVSGSYHQQVGGNFHFVTYDQVPPTMLSGDLRFLFGLGLRGGNTKSFGVSFDAYVATALTSMLKMPGANRGADIGFTLGFFRNMKGRHITNLLRKRTPKAEE